VIDKITLAYSILRSRAYIVLTDTKAQIMIPLMDINSMENIILLSGQTSALKDFQRELGGLIKQHEQRIEALSK